MLELTKKHVRMPFQRFSLVCALSAQHLKTRPAQTQRPVARFFGSASHTQVPQSSGHFLCLHLEPGTVLDTEKQRGVGSGHGAQVGSELNWLLWAEPLWLSGSWN